MAAVVRTVLYGDKSEKEHAHSQNQNHFLHANKKQDKQHVH
jgi:hypothetical protein